MALPAGAKTALWYFGIYFGVPIALMLGLYLASLGLNWATVTVGFLPPGVYELWTEFYNGAWETASFVVMAPFGIGMIGLAFTADIIAPYLIAGLNGIFAWIGGKIGLSIILPDWSPMLQTAISTFDTLTTAIINLQPKVGVSG